MSTINVRVDDEVKKQASELFADLGIDLSAAINMFLRQAIMREGLPFEVKREIPNEETRAALKEAEEMIAGKQPAKAYSDLGELFKELDEYAQT